MKSYEKILQNFMFSKTWELLVQRSPETYYPQYGELFLFSNELLKESPAEILTNKDILTITSSGDHIISNIFQGANDITAFDINIFAKYYASLKLAMIQVYDFDEFCMLLNRLYQTSNALAINNWVICKILLDVKGKLTSDEVLFWESYVNTCNDFFDHQLVRSLFMDVTKQYNMNNSLYSNKKYYRKLQKRLKDVNVNYVDSDLFELKKKVNKKFDYVYVGNLLICMGYREQLMAFEYLYDLLNNDGVIYTYGDIENEFLPTEFSIGNSYSQQVIHTSDGIAYYSKYRKKGKENN